MPLSDRIFDLAGCRTAGGVGCSLYAAVGLRGDRLCGMRARLYLGGEAFMAFADEPEAETKARLRG